MVCVARPAMYFCHCTILLFHKGVPELCAVLSSLSVISPTISWSSACTISSTHTHSTSALVYQTEVATSFRQISPGNRANLLAFFSFWSWTQKQSEFQFQDTPFIFLSNKVTIRQKVSHWLWWTVLPWKHQVGILQPEVLAGRLASKLHRTY